MSAPARHVVVRYSVHPQRLDEHLALLGAVFQALGEQAPAGLSYHAYRAAGDLAFVHLATISTPDGTNPLAAVPAFRAFTKELDARCSAPVVSQSLEPVGRYPR